MKSRVVGALSLAIMTVFLCIPDISTATTITIANDTTKIDDTTLYSNVSADNGGGGLELRAGMTTSAGNRRILIRFDLSSIPSNASISNVTVQLVCTKVPSLGVANVHSLFRVTKPWVEGSGIGVGSGGLIVIGAASWSYQQCSAVPWTTDGGDFSSTTSAATNVGTSIGPIVWTGSGLVSDVQAWVNGSQTNNGWIIIGDESMPKSVRLYASSEDPLNSPSITITYNSPAEVNDSVWESFE